MDWFWGSRRKLTLPFSATTSFAFPETSLIWSDLVLKNSNWATIRWFVFETTFHHPILNFSNFNLGRTHSRITDRHWLIFMPRFLSCLFNDTLIVYPAAHMVEIEIHVAAYRLGGIVEQAEAIAHEMLTVVVHF